MLFSQQGVQVAQFLLSSMLFARLAVLGNSEDGISEATEVHLRYDHV